METGQLTVKVTVRAKQLVMGLPLVGKVAHLLMTTL